MNKQKTARATAARSTKRINATVIARAVAIAMSASSVAYAQAPAQDTVKLETITISAIRKGIEDAINVKKNSDSIVEAISAEDIGKLPDSSIAESIARLPGLAAQRTAGRAQNISIRGLSPEFSTGLLNGREQASTGDSRSVEFDQFPSELLSGATIYKTPDGALTGQGLSGTIDLQTVRPLNFAKRTVAVNFRDEKSGKGTTSTGKGNRFSLSYIDQFADRKLGVALGLARLDGTSGATNRFESWGGGTAKLNGQGADINVPHNGFNAWTDQTKETRTGLMGVFEYRPSKDFSTVLDVFHSKFDKTSSKIGFQAPLNDSWKSPTDGYDPGGILVAANVVNGTALSGTFNNVRGVVRNDADTTNDKLTSIGLLNKLNIAGWAASADLNYSNVKRKQQIIETTAGTVGSATGPGALANVTFTGSGPSTVFSSSINFADPNIIKLTDVQGWGGGPGTPQAGYTKLPTITDTIKGLRVAGKRALPEGLPFSNVEVGVNTTDRSKRREFVEGQLVIKGGNPFGATSLPGVGTGVAALTGLNIVTFAPGPNLTSIYDIASKKDPDIYNKDWLVTEKVFTVFGKLDVDYEFMGLPIRGNVGAQVVNSKQASTAYQVADTLGSSRANRSASTNSDGLNYTDVLPSANLAIDLGADQTLRFAMAKVMARANMNDMRASREFSVDQNFAVRNANGTTTNVPTYVGSGGNPRLNPYRANAIDISYEKYFGKKAYISVAAFNKDLKSYIISLQTAFDYTPYITPSTNKAASNIGRFTAPTNGSGGTINGTEFTVSLPFDLLMKPLEGFGMSGSYSNTRSSLNLAGLIPGATGTIPLPGLSKEVAGLTLYYERNGFSVRASERVRSDFLGDVTNGVGDREYTFIKGERIVDAQLGYEFQSGPVKGLSLTLQAQNLTDAKFTRYDFKGNTVEETTYGKTILFGANYKF